MDIIDKTLTPQQEYRELVKHKAVYMSPCTISIIHYVRALRYADNRKNDAKELFEVVDFLDYMYSIGRCPTSYDFAVVVNYVVDMHQTVNSSGYVARKIVQNSTFMRHAANRSYDSCTFFKEFPFLLHKRCFYSDTSLRTKLVLFCLDPWRVYKKCGYKPNLRGFLLQSVDSSNIRKMALIYKDALFTTNFKICAKTAESLISINPDYAMALIRKLDKFANATEIRIFLLRNQHLVQYLTCEDLEKTKLTAKQWILFANRLDASYKFADDVLEWLEMETSIEIIMGSSTASKPLSRALEKCRAETT